PYAAGDAKDGAGEVGAERHLLQHPRRVPREGRRPRRGLEGPRAGIEPRGRQGTTLRRSPLPTPAPAAPGAHWAAPRGGAGAPARGGREATRPDPPPRPDRTHPGGRERRGVGTKLPMRATAAGGRAPTPNFVMASDVMIEAYADSPDLDTAWDSAI